MMDVDRLIVDEDYNWIDTTTGAMIELEDAFDLVNELSKENQELKDIVLYYKTLLDSLKEEAKRISKIRPAMEDEK